MATVVATEANSSPPFPAPDQIYRLTVSQFKQMITTGTLGEDDAVELLHGILVTKMPKNPAHRVATRKSVRALESVLPAGWIVLKEEPIVIPPGSNWEPDIAVVRSELEFDASRDVTPADCCLIVEVADANSRARSERRPIAAKAGIPVFWVVSVENEDNLRWPTKVEVYNDPDQSSGLYRSRLDFESDGQVPVVIDGQEIGTIAVADLLP
jgi:Uma2 family endonuclease